MITVLRLGHRPMRDKRITTHCALVARAFGANKFVYTGDHDAAFEKSIASVVKQCGGEFEVVHCDSWKKALSEEEGKRVHLTMYGEPLQKEIVEIRKQADIVVVVGGQKVPPEIYGSVDWNVAVGNQPHSEVSALAVFLHEYFEGRELSRVFGGKIFHKNIYRLRQ